MSSRSLSGTKVSVKVTASIQNELTDLSVVSVAQPSLNYAPSIANGISAGQANRGWQFSGTIDIGDQVIFDLYDMGGTDIGAGAGLDALGQAIAFENIAAIVIVNDNDYGEPGQLEIKPHAQHGWAPIGTHTVATGGALKAKGMLMKVQPEEGGFDVTTLSSQRISLQANGGPVDYSIYLLARDDDYESSSSSSSGSSSSSSSLSSSSVSTSHSSLSISTSSNSSSSSKSLSSLSSVSSSSSSSSSSSESSLSAS